jgi:hypothetical protein
MKILFILKDRFYNTNHANSYGLINSSNQVAQYLESIGNECKIVLVIDGNEIDKEVYNFKPDLVIIEALWVSGEKMKELINIPRYSNISWVIRIHSNIGFLSAETWAFRYINSYIDLCKDNLYISFNNKEFNKNMQDIFNYEFEYLPNIITIKNDTRLNYLKCHIDIGCFGSLRTLKNQCFQAICAIEAAERLGKYLRFHITIDFEQDGVNPILKNLEQIFSGSGHELVKHQWLNNNEFQDLIKEMDIGLQISYTESFNIVTADFVVNNVPIIVSEAIDWMPECLQVSTVDFEKVVRKIITIYKLRNSKLLKRRCTKKLNSYNKLAKEYWDNFLKLI